MENKPHLNQIESLRGFAALAVSLYHFSAYFTWSDLSSWFFAAGVQSVEIFYMISGFIIPYSLYKSNYKIRSFFRYLLKRTLRLLPPYILTIILIQVVGILLCVFLWDCVHDINFRQIAINALFLADLFPQYDWINPIFATLEVEVHFYLIIGLLFPLINKNDWMFLFFCLIVMVLGVFTRDYDTFLVNSPYFIVGLSIFYIKEKGWKPIYLTSILVAIALVSQFYYWEDLWAILLGFVAIMWLPNNLKALNLTGKISYSYYLVHGLSGGWLLYFTSKTAFGASYPLILIGIAMLFSWLCALTIYWFVERYSLRISKKIKYHK